MEAVPTLMLETEVLAKPTRRRFTAKEKLRILRLADACAPGEQGALLRREGISPRPCRAGDPRERGGSSTPLLQRSEGPRRRRSTRARRRTPS